MKNIPFAIVAITIATVVAFGTSKSTALAANATVGVVSQGYETIRGTINAVTYLIIGLIWLGVAAFLLLKKKKGPVHVLFFTVFYFYLYKVFDYTLLQFQSLLLVRHFVPNLILRGVEAGRSVNLISLVSLGLADMKTSLLNILMMVPLGFGLPFITDFRMKKVVLAGFILSAGIESVQFVTGFMANTTFRVADINDLIFNTVGATIGYLSFTAFARIYRYIFSNRNPPANPVLHYIGERLNSLNRDRTA